MTIKVEYRIKFRAGGITLGTVKGTVYRAIPLPIPAFDHVVADDRGVYIRVVVY